MFELIVQYVLAEGWQRYERKLTQLARCQPAVRSTTTADSSTTCELVWNFDDFDTAHAALRRIQRVKSARAYIKEQ